VEGAHRRAAGTRWSGCPRLSHPGPWVTLTALDAVGRDGSGFSRRGCGRIGSMRGCCHYYAQFRPDPRSPRVVEYVEGGRRRPRVSTPDSGGNGDAAGRAYKGSPPSYIAGQPGEAEEGTPQGELPSIPQRLPDQLPQSSTPTGVIRSIVSITLRCEAAVRQTVPDMAGIAPVSGCLSMDLLPTQRLL
jgi:hypothetical protein